MIDTARFYKPQEVADLLGCSKINIHDVVSSGRLARTRIGAGKTGYRVRGSDLVAFIDANTEGGPASKMSFKFLRMK